MNKIHTRPVLRAAFLAVLATASTALIASGLRMQARASRALEVAANPTIKATPVTMTATPTPVSTAPVASVLPEAAAPIDAPTATTEATLSYPDGTTWSLQNGVTVALVPSFTTSVPFAKIVGTEQDERGLTWYVHENGARSTSFLDKRGESFAMAYMPIAATHSMGR